MIVLVQRVAGAVVSVDREPKARIGKGLLLLVGIIDGDTEDELRYCAGKCANLRIFEDAEGKMNLSLLDVGGEVLSVSQFTLGARVRKGRRPSFDRAMKPPRSEELFDRFCDMLGEEGVSVVKKGDFNDGPVTIIVDSEERR